MQLYQKLEATLKKENNFITDDGAVKKWVVIHKAQAHDDGLLRLLIEEPSLKAHFFKEVAGHLVFNLPLFLQFLEQKAFLADSYTAYKNKIGLTDGAGRYLKAGSDVVLAWPYKDCILEGGQSTEERGRDEIFFNTTLAQDEITQLLEPKVLAAGKRYDGAGVKSLEGFTRDAQGHITDNLIIKGNNLLALHSIKKEFAGRVKLIYIDPPYNPQSRSNTFTYNNTFNESSWLTFMKNRLEVAKKILSTDGTLVVAIDENEMFELGVLIKELFGEHDLHCITIIHNPRGVQGTNFSYTHEFAFFIIPKGKRVIENRKIEEAEIEWSPLRNWGTESERSDAKNCFYPILVNQETQQIIGFGEVSPDDEHPSVNEFQGAIVKIYPIDTKKVERKWRYARQSIESIKHLLRVVKKGSRWDIELGKDFGLNKTVWQDSRYDANVYGTQVVKELVLCNC